MREPNKALCLIFILLTPTLGNCSMRCSTSCIHVVQQVARPACNSLCFNSKNCVNTYAYAPETKNYANEI